MSRPIYDVIVIGGGAVGLATAYEIAKAGSTVILLEQNTFFNQAGSSGDLNRMFRTMYTEDYLADLAKDALDIWDELESDAGVSLRWMGGLLNFGDPKWLPKAVRGAVDTYPNSDYSRGSNGTGSPEGTLLGPIPNLKRLDLSFKQWSAEQIEKRYPFRNLPKDWEGLYAPDNGVINVQLLLRTLYGLAKDYGAAASQYRKVQSVEFNADSKAWEVAANDNKGTSHTYQGRKIVITSGAYTNHVLQPNFGLSLDLDIWEMVASYFSVNPGPSGVVFPSMWFQFQPEDPVTHRSNLFYGFPAVPWGPPNVARVAVDAATRRIKDPDERLTNVVNPDDIKDTQDFINAHVVGVDATVPAFTLSCLQTNVVDNNFVLDYLPEKYLKGGPKDSIALFCAGWAMKFVPTLGRTLKEMVLDGGPKSVPAKTMEHFAITRDGVIAGGVAGADSVFTFKKQAHGSSMRGVHNMGH